MASNASRVLRIEATEHAAEFDIWGGRLSLPAGSSFALEESLRKPIQIARTLLKGPAAFFRSAGVVRKFEQQYLIITFLDAGAITHKGGQEHVVRGPAIMLSRPSGGYHATMEPKDEKEITVYQALIAPHLLASSVYTNDIRSFSAPIETGHSRAAREIIESLFVNGPLLDYQIVSGLENAFLNCVTKFISNETELGSRKSNIDKHYKSVIDYISDNIDDEGLTAEKVARHIGVSSRYFSLILASRGERFNTILNDRRLTLAHSLLSSRRGYRAIEIAALCGFRSMPHFHRSFRAKYGFTPMSLAKTANAAK